MSAPEKMSVPIATHHAARVSRFSLIFLFPLPPGFISGTRAIWNWFIAWAASARCFTFQPKTANLHQSHPRRWLGFATKFVMAVADFLMPTFRPPHSFFTKWIFWCRALGLAGKSYPFSMSYDRIGAAEIILTEARRVQADFVMLPSFMLHYAAPLKRSKFRVIADAIDVLTDLTARSLLLTARTLVGRPGLYSNYLASRAQERIFLPHCCEVWATSLLKPRLLPELLRT